MPPTSGKGMPPRPPKPPNNWASFSAKRAFRVAISLAYLQAQASRHASCWGQQQESTNQSPWGSLTYVSGHCPLQLLVLLQLYSCWAHAETCPEFNRINLCVLRPRVCILAWLQECHLNSQAGRHPSVPLTVW
jgi:hypothetical protein